MTQLLKVTLLTLTLPLFLNATCTYPEHFNQGTGQCIVGEPTLGAPEPLVTCAPGERMQQQGVPGSCEHDTDVAPPPGLFLANPCGAGKRAVQGNMNPESCVDMPNTPPIANAGGSKVVTEGISPVILTGGSRDMDEDKVTYEWVFIQRPAGSTVTLDDNTSATASFEPDVPGIYRVKLVVNDGTFNSEPDIITIKINQVPTASFTGPSENIWGQDFDLNAGASSDSDGVVAIYNWIPSYDTSVINSIPAPDLGTHTYSLSVTDDDGTTSPEVVKVIETVMCEGQEDINLIDEVEGTVNIDAVKNNSESCYKIDLSSNNGTEKYAFYMNLLDGTTNTSTKDMNIKMYSQSGTLLHTFETGHMDYNSDDDPYYVKGHMKEQFEIGTDGIYYFKISRESNYAANYRFSIHPSLENGLVQDSKGEINDFREMATPLTLNADNTLEDVSGKLNMTRLIEDTSLKYSDNTDWYSIDIQDPGKYAFYMNLLNGTQNDSQKNMSIIIYDMNGVVKTFDTGHMDAEDDHMNEEFDIIDTGIHHIYIYRKTGYSANYTFSIDPSI